MNFVARLRVLFVLVASAHAQAPSVPAPTPKFDAASIKPCQPTDGAGGGREGKGGGGGSYMSRSPGRINITCMTVAMLIDTYLQFGNDHLVNDLGGPFDPRRMRGGPPWMYSDRYTVTAATTDPSANGPTGRGTNSDKILMGTMLLALLEERFQLRFHRELEEIPAYALTIAKSGLKLKPIEPGSCVVYQPGMNTERDTGDKPLCGVHTGWDGPNWTLDVTGRSLDQVALALGWLLNRPVIDKSGNTGLFTLGLKFAHDDSTPGQLPVEFQSPFTSDPGGESIFTALDKVGFKLVPDKAPHGYVVVDRLERPSAN
jgi:uncharacterized protein (TIGR03435 family)